MNSLSKCVCLTEIEFRILQNWYDISNLNGFVMKDMSGAENVQEVYNLGIFNLYKNKMIKCLDDKIVPSEYIDIIFRNLKKSMLCICLDSDRAEISSTCMYFGVDNSIVIMSPGFKKDEYARLQVIEHNDFRDYLLDSGVLFEETVDKDIIDLMDVNEGEKVLSVKAKFEIRDTKSGIEISSISVNEGVLFDKILVTTGERIKSYIYSTDTLVEVILNVVNNYDIG